jgi:predicted dehydrogenase
MFPFRRRTRLRPVRAEVPLSRSVHCHESFAGPNGTITRRRFLGGTLLATAAVSTPAVLRGFAAEEANPAPVEFKRKVKLGLIGCGTRGKWIGHLFARHGGYQLHAVADYFPDVAEQAGAELGVDAARRFATLSGCQRVFESGVDAVALEVPPYFFSGMAQAAVAAGLHVYMAKPVAVDVPGALQIGAAARAATDQQRVFFVDYQMPTDPVNLEILRRVRDPQSGFGKIVRVATSGSFGHFPDPPKTANLESRLQKLIWVNDIALGCDYLGNYDIHAIDAALWALGERPVAALGASRVCRVNPHGDSHDICLLTYEYASGVVHDHQGNALKNFLPNDLACRLHGPTGNALLNYWNTASFRSGDDSYSGEVQNLYEAGVVRNIAAFYRKVTGGDFANDNVPRAVDGALTCVLGRIAGERRQRVTLEQVLRENTRLEVDLTGLKT